MLYCSWPLEGDIGPSSMLFSLLKKCGHNLSKQHLRYDHHTADTCEMSEERSFPVTLVELTFSLRSVAAGEE